MKLSLFLLLCVVFAEHIHIFLREIESTTPIQLGTISYDKEANSTTFEANIQDPIPEGKYCLGTNSIEGKECFVLQKIDEQLKGQFRLYVNSQKDICDLTFKPSGEKLDASVYEVSKGPEPVISPVSSPRKQEPLTQKVVRKRVVENEAGEKVEIEEEVEEVVEVDERSWVQKNWVYLVVPMVIFMVLAPADK